MCAKETNRLNQLWSELKRRKVFRVVAMYAGSAYIIIELVNNVSEPLHLPEWTATVIILLLIIGFPIVAILSWIFDITPEGVKKTESIEVLNEQEQSSAPVRRKLRVSDIIIAVLVVVVGILAYPKIFKRDKFEGLRDANGKISVAVMPFDNLTGDTTLNFWQIGIPEILINDLGASNELFVMSSQVMSEVFGNMRQIQTASVLPSMAKKAALKLKVSVYIKGSYQLSGNKMRIMANLVNTKDGVILKPFNVEGNLEYGYIDIGDSISNQVKNYLEIESLKHNVDVGFQKAYTSSSEAYRNYIEGLISYQNGEIEAARQFFTEALEIDSTFTMVMFYMAWTYRSQGNYKETTEWTERAYEHIDKLPLLYQNWIRLWYANHISKNYDDMQKYLNILANQESKSRLYWYDVAAYYVYSDPEKAAKCIDKILEINKERDEQWNFLRLYTYGWNGYCHCYHNIGEHEKENKLYEIGLEFFPESQFIRFNQAVCALSLGDTVKAGEYIDFIILICEKKGISDSQIEYYLAKIYDQAKIFDIAEEHYQNATKLDPENKFNGRYAEMLVNNDIDLERGLEMNQRLQNIYPNNPFYIRLQGYCYYKQGKHEEALKTLKISDSLFKYWLDEENYEYLQLVEQALANQEK